MALQAKMVLWPILSFILIFPVFFTRTASSREIPREPLDRFWEEHMLAGRSGIYSNGKRTQFEPDSSFQSAKGSPRDAWLKKKGIAVSDLRGTRLIGLFRKGGWILEGGLLAKAKTQSSTIELYGKRVVRAEPVSILSFILHRDNQREYGYEFFLLHRKNGMAKAHVVKKWIFNPEDTPVFMDNFDVVRGFLRYDPATRIATVTITGLKRPIGEHIDLSKELRR